MEGLYYHLMTFCSQTKGVLEALYFNLTGIKETCLFAYGIIGYLSLFGICESARGMVK